MAEGNTAPGTEKVYANVGEKLTNKFAERIFGPRFERAPIIKGLVTTLVAAPFLGPAAPLAGLGAGIGSAIADVRWATVERAAPPRNVQTLNGLNININTAAQPHAA